MHVKQHRLKSITLFLLIFALVFAPKVPALGSIGDLSFLFAAFFLGLHCVRNKSLDRNLLFFLALLTLLFVATATHAALILPPDMSFIAGLVLKPIRILVTVFGIFAFIRLIAPMFGRERIVRAAFYSVSAHGLIMVAQLLVPDFKDFVYGLLNSGEYRSTFDYQFRMGGLSGGSGGAVLSVVQSIGVLLSPLVLKLDKNLWVSLIHFCLVIVCLVSVLICGRSGLMAIIIFLPPTIIFLSKKPLFALRSIMLLIVSAIFLLTAVFHVIDLFLFAEGDSLLKGVASSFRRSVDSILLMFETGVIRDATLSTLSSQIIFPVDTYILFFGDPTTLWVNQFERTVDSDIGIIRNIWGFGLLGSIVYWSLIAFMQLKLIVRARNDPFAATALVVGFVMIFFHAKELFLYVRMLFPLYCLLYFLTSEFCVASSDAAASFNKVGYD